MDTPLQLCCYHILATLPEDYDISRIPGTNDLVDGLSLSCGFSAQKKTTKKRRRSNKPEEETASTSDQRLTLDFYFRKEDDSGEQNEKSDETDSVNPTPWKMAVLHTGTKNVHWHFIYISSHSAYHTNSRLGLDIFNTKNKVQKVKCLQCLYNYLNSGNGRKVISDNFTNDSKLLVLCEEHTKDVTEIFFNRSTSEEYEDDNLLRSIICNSSKGIYFSNHELLEMFIEEKAFSDSSARLVLSKTVQGRNYLFRPKVNETIKTAILTCKLMTFQETPMQRLERAKKYYLKYEKDANFESQIGKLKRWLRSNEISVRKFAKFSFKHFNMTTGKKNNLFFYGPPSTGKSMVMESLVSCHYNYTRLTGLIDNSPFNFSSLVHSNACFMDEIKLTDNHFEQWKLIASGLPCSTDVKYQDKAEITKCVLYTCSNYEIDSFCNVPEAGTAIHDRTYTLYVHAPCKEYFKISPHSWDMFWKEYN